MFFLFLKAYLTEFLALIEVTETVLPGIMIFLHLLFWNNMNYIPNQTEINFFLVILNNTLVLYFLELISFKY